MAFYARIRDGELDIMSHMLPSGKGPFMMFVTKQSMLETLDDCYNFIVSATKDSSIGIFEKELLKRQCIGVCCKTNNLVIVIMANNKFDSKSIQKLVYELRHIYIKSNNFIQNDLDNFIKDNQDVNPDKFDLINYKIDEIKEVMIKNIDQIIKRGESIESLAIKTEHLEAEAIRFEIRARKMNSICNKCSIL